MARFVKDMTRDEIIKCIESMDNRFLLNAKDKHSLKVAISAIKAMPWDQCDDLGSQFKEKTNE